MQTMTTQHHNSDCGRKSYVVARCHVGLLALGLIFLGACGSLGTSSSGGGSSGSSTVGGEITGGSADTTDSVNLNSVDAFSADISAIDLSQVTSSVSSSVAKGLGADVGDDSRAGCELNQLKKEAIRNGKEASIFQCFVGAMQVATSDFVVPDGAYAYYELLLPEDDEKSGAQGDAFSMKMRVGRNVTTTNSTELQICEDGKQLQSMVVTSDTSTRVVTFDIKNHFTADGSFEHTDDDTEGKVGAEHVDDGDGELDDEERALLRDGGVIDDWFELTGSVVAETTATGRIDSIDEVDSATISGKFDGNFGVGSLSFTYDDDGGPEGGAFNSISGSFAGSFGSGDTSTGHLYGEFDGSSGTGKYSASGSFPGIPAQYLPDNLDATAVYCPLPPDECDPETQFDTVACQVSSPAVGCYCLEVSTTGACTFDDSGDESFTITKDSAGELVFTVADSSIYSDNVVATTLPTSVDPIAKNFGDNAWDCTVPATSTLVALDVDELEESPAMQVCFAKEEETWGDEELGDHDSCYQDVGEDHIEKGEAEKGQFVE